MTRMERQNKVSAPWTHTAWSFPGLVDRMLFGRSTAAELAPKGIQTVVRTSQDTVGVMDDDGIADLQGQAAVIDVHEAWF